MATRDDFDDRTGPVERRTVEHIPTYVEDPGTPWLWVAVIVIVLGGLLWYFVFGGPRQTSGVAPAPAPTVTQTVPAPASTVERNTTILPGATTTVPGPATTTTVPGPRVTVPGPTRTVPGPAVTVTPPSDQGGASSPGAGSTDVPPADASP